MASIRRPMGKAQVWIRNQVSAYLENPASRAGFSRCRRYHRDTMASTTTLKLPAKLKARIARLANQTGRSARNVMLEALERGVARAERMREFVTSSGTTWRRCGGDCRRRNLSVSPGHHAPHGLGRGVQGPFGAFAFYRGPKCAPACNSGNGSWSNGPC